MRKWVIAAMVLSLVGTACDGEITIRKKGESKPAAAPVKAASAAEVEETATKDYTSEIFTDDYVYTSVGKRDPFRSYLLDLVTEELEEKIESPLQQFDLSAFKVSGIVWGVTNPTALVEAGGQSFLIRVGTLIGRNWGRVSNIKRDAIVVAEEYKDAEGRNVVNKIELKLPVKQLESGSPGVEIDAGNP